MFTSYNQQAMKHSTRQSNHVFKLASLAIILFIILGMVQPPKVSAQGDETWQKLLPLVGGALVESGGDHWEKATNELTQFQELWEGQAPSVPGDIRDAIEDNLTKASTALQQQDKTKSREALSALVKELHQYNQSMKDQDQTTDTTGKEAAKLLYGMAEQSLTSLEKGNLEAAQSHYKTIISKWSKIEGPIRQGHFGVYSDLERHMSLIRIALQAQPAKEDQAISELNTMLTLLQDYQDGKLDDTADSSVPITGTQSLADAIVLLRGANKSIESGNIDSATEQMDQFITLWPSVEGEVSISSSTVYRDTEDNMSVVQSYLLSAPPKLTQATQLIDNMLNNLEPLAERRAYSAWDAALILLREGLEAILVLAALLAFVKKADNKVARNYIWAGSATGLLLSGILAVVLSYVISTAISGSTRELIEGVVGLLAVVMMLTVGYWLHSKSNIQAWNQYLTTQVGGALQRGSLWSLFTLSGLAILREGAETTIFYIGMAPSIEPIQLLIGISSAVVILIILGFCIINFSVKLPIGIFMSTAAVLIYYLVVRFGGESIHSLQIAGVLPAHNISWLPSVNWLGLFPTWETFSAQFILLCFILLQFIIRKLRH